jgi:D-tyrosyl-tRNA(Tyr) deacylase
MRAVLQRVSQASVKVEGSIVGAISKGWLVLVGVAKEDSAADASWLAEKILGVRAFPDADGKMNLSVVEIGGEILAVSQFTLLGDLRSGRRPGFSDAAAPDHAQKLYDSFVEALRGSGLKTATGVFQTHMDVSLVNDGPVTLLLDSKKIF